MKNYILQNIRKLEKENNDMELDRFLKELLQKNPNNLDILFRLAILGVYSGNEDKSAEYLNKILEIDPDNVKAYILLAYIYSLCFVEPSSFGISKELFQKLNAINSSDNSLQAMVEYVKSWYYEDTNDINNYEKCLKKSIELDPANVLSYEKLGNYYISINKLEEGKSLISQALKNVKLQFTDTIHMQNPTDIDEFLNERIKGIHITDILYKGIQDHLMKI